jgi:glycerol-3-phosphate dehydrogenase
MQRDLAAMAATRFDVLVIGGGITGATVAWDATLRGLRVGLIEKGDFGQGTSSATSKLIHGGLRYLRQLEFGLVRESLRERRIMLTITPHLVSPLPFLIPAYGWNARLALSAAARVYNTLSYDRNRVPHDDQRIPKARFLNPKQTTDRVPTVPGNNLSGSLLYYDAQMYDPARHLMEFICSAVRHGAHVANYAEAEAFLLDDDAVQSVTVRDHLTDTTHTLSARLIVNAAGPWADGVLHRIRDDATAPVHHSKGIHIITRPVTSLDQALALQTPDGRHLFMLPWREHTLIGTTDTPFEGDPDDVAITEADLRAFIDTINATFPPAQLTRDDVLHFYGGLRPLVDAEATTDTYRASRKHAIIHHADEGMANLYTAIGGKYTTARHLAEQLVNQLFERLDRPSVPCTTDVVPTVGGDTGPFRHFLRRVQQQYSALPGDTACHLARSYGTRLHELMRRAQRGPALMKRPADSRTPDIMVQVDYAVEREMARTLDDVLLRRTGIGTLGEPSLDTLEAVAQRMAGLLNWDTHRFDDEVETMRDRYWPARSPTPTTA